MKQHPLSVMTVITLLAATWIGGGCGSLRKQGQLPTDKPLAVPANNFVRNWANDLKLDKKDPVDELHLAGDTLFVYTKEHLVYGIDRAGGTLKYAAQPTVSGGVLRPPLVLGDRVVFPSGASIDIFNNRGRVQRTVELEKPIRSSATGAGDIIYIGLDHTGGTGTVASINYTRPYKVINWELMTFGAVTASPVLFDRVIYAGSEDGGLYAVTDERGQLWSLENGAGFFKTQGKFISDLRVDETGVYAANTDSKLYCLDRGTGRIKWQYYAAAPLKTSPVVTATMVYQLVPGQGIVGIDKANGQFNRQPLWSVGSAVQVLTEDEQHVYLRRRDNRLMAVSKQTGDIVFTSKGNPFEVFTTNTGDATIYAATRDGKVWAVKPVLQEGSVGTIVMDFRADPVAAAQ